MEITTADRYFDRTFILSDRFINYAGRIDPQKQHHYYVTIRTLYEDGSETKTTQYLSAHEINKRIRYYNSLNTGSIYNMIKAVHLSPDNFWHYCVCPHDRI